VRVGPPSTASPREPLLTRERLLAAALRGAAFGGWSVAVVAALAGAAGWSALFALTFGLTAAPAGLLEAWGRRAGGWPRHLLAAAGAAALGAVGLLAAFLQVSYLHGRVSGAAFHPLDGLADGTAALGRYGLEVLAVVAAVAPPFGWVALARLRGRGRWAQLGLAVAGSSAVAFATIELAGFRGLPQPGWLLRAGWFAPELGTALMVQPIAGSLGLVAAAWAGERVERSAPGDPPDRAEP